MPGLFGAVRFSAQSSPRDLRAVVSRMADVLGHSAEDATQVWTGKDDVFVGRVGAPHLHHVPWPTEPGAQALARTFVAGVLHNGSLATQSGAKAASWISTLSGMRGFFSIAHYDPSTRRFLLAADRRGSFPLYYAQVDGHLLFAPEIRALLAYPNLHGDLDVAAAATLISCGHLMGDQTLLSPVHRLRGGEALIVERGMCERRTYWRFAPGSRSGGRTDRELELELGSLVRESASRHLGDPEKTIVFLSGGTDSRGILASALETVGGNGGQLNTVTWGVDEGGVNSDVAIAGRIAEAMSLRHRFLARDTANYEEHFTRANALIGSGSDVAAYHPLEYSFMQKLRGAGFERALRGDETMGWLTSVRTVEEALKKVKLHRLGDDPQMRSYIRAEHYDDWCDASQTVFQEATLEVDGSNPNDAKDYLYFAHRLQGYLNTASYYKLCWLDQRNVLLDDEILNFLEWVPARLRVDKLLYRRAMARAFPQLWQLPFAKASNLEHWSAVLAGDGSVREFIRASLNDRRSEIWRFFQRDALMTLFESTSTQTLQSSTKYRAQSSLRSVLLRLPQPALARAREWRTARAPLRLPAHAILFRIMVLKQFVDELGPPRPRA